MGRLAHETLTPFSRFAHRFPSLVTLLRGETGS